MLNHKQTIHTDISASGKSDKTLQTNVLDRARLTLFNITDIWKSKIHANKLDKPNDKSNANRRALNVLNVWARHRRSPTPVEPPLNACSHNHQQHHNHRQHRHSRHHHAASQQMHTEIYTTASERHAARSVFVSNENKTNKHKPNNNTCAPKTARRKNKQNVVTDYNGDIHDMLTRRRSFDLGVNHVQHDIDHMMPLLSSLHRRRSSCDSILSVQKEKHAGRTNRTNRIVQQFDGKSTGKTKSRDADVALAEPRNSRSLRTLTRQSSILPTIRVNDFGVDCNLNIDKRMSESKNGDESDGHVRKPRKKKLSFREPVVFNEQLQQLRSIANAGNTTTAIATTTSIGNSRQVIKACENCINNGESNASELIDDEVWASQPIHKSKRILFKHI